MAHPISLPQDKGGHPVQVLAPSGERQHVTSTGSSQRVTLPANAKVLRVSAIEDIYIRFGDSTVTATQDGNSVLFPRGVEIMGIPRNATDVAIIQRTTGGVVQIEALD
jgi:hypothetical protein